MKATFKREDGGLMLFFDTQAEVDEFIKVYFPVDPGSDPDGPIAIQRLLEIRQWCDANDPQGSTAAGHIVRLLRHEIDQLIYREKGPRGFTENN